MATDIVQGLFGMTPESYQLQQQAAAREQAMQFAQMDPFQRAAYGTFLGGSQLGGAIGGALGAQDPQLQMIARQQELLKTVNPNDPDSLAKAAQAAARFNPQLAVALSDKATALMGAMTKQAQESAAATSSLATAKEKEFSISEQGRGQKLAETGKYTPESIVTALRDKDFSKLVAIDKMTKPAADFISKAVELGFGDKPTYGAYTPTQAAAINKAIFDEDIKKKTAGAAYINVPVSLVDKESNLRKDYIGETKPISQVISTAGRIEKLLNMGSLGEIIAQKQFSKLAGDNNISNKDVDNLSNFGDLGQRLAGTLSRFFEGSYSEAQRQEALKLVRELKASGTAQYSQIQQQYIDRAKAENIPEKTITFIAPSLPKDMQTPAQLPPEGTRLRNKKTNKIEVVRNGQLVPE